MTNFFIKHFIKDYEEINKMSVRTAYGLLASVVGIFCNVLLFIVKFMVGSFMGSISVMADGFNNLSDAGSSIISFVGVKLASKPADKDHPFGHGRMEYVAALAVAFIIIELGLSFLKDSIKSINEPRQLQFRLFSIFLLLFSIGVKLWLGIFYKNIGKRMDSKIVMAAATDAMADVIATAATIVSMLVFRITGVNLDAFVGMGVSFVIMWAGVGIIRDTLEPLLGQAVTKAEYDKITEFVKSYDGIVGTHDLIVHNYGPSKSMASIHAEVPNFIGVEVSHEIIDRIEREAMKELGIFLVIHMDPIEVNNKKLDTAKRHVEEEVKRMDPILSIHDFRMVDGEYQINLIFDLVVPAAYTKEKRKELCQDLRTRLHKIDQRYQCVIQVEISYIAEEK